MTPLLLALPRWAQIDAGAGSTDVPVEPAGYLVFSLPLPLPLPCYSRLIPMQLLAPLAGRPDAEQRQMTVAILE